MRMPPLGACIAAAAIGLAPGCKEVHETVDAAAVVRAEIDHFCERLAKARDGTTTVRNEQRFFEIRAEENAVRYFKWEQRDTAWPAITHTAEIDCFYREIKGIKSVFVEGARAWRQGFFKDTNPFDGVVDEPKFLDPPTLTSIKDNVQDAYYAIVEDGLNELDKISGK